MKNELENAMDCGSMLALCSIFMIWNAEMVTGICWVRVFVVEYQYILHLLRILWLAAQL